MLTEPFQTGKEVLDKIIQNGFQAYFVGGCVRDLLLHRPIGDIDITTSAKPTDIQQIFENVIPVGIEHGTVIVRHRKQSFEVTTFRVDGTYSDQRHPDQVQFINRLDQDLQRRDFTINALAMNLDGQIIDLYEGKKDLKRKMIRTVGDGNERFIEDPLRIIRAIRFASQLGFFIEPETLSAIRKVKSQINNIAIERITTELTKLVSGKYIQFGLDYLKTTEVYKHLPIMVEYPYIIENLPKEMKPLSSFGEFIAICHYLNPSIPVSDWIKKWKCSNKIKNEVNQLVAALEYYANYGLDRWLLYQLDQAFYHGFTTIANILFTEMPICNNNLKRISDELPIQSKRELAFDGNDLVSMFPNRSKGRWIYTTLNKIEQEVVMGMLENKNSMIKEWIKCNPPEIN